MLKALRPPPVTLSELPADGCKWPVEDDADGVRGRHLFCGAERAEGSSYCAGHKPASIEPDPDWTADELKLLALIRRGRLS